MGTRARLSGVTIAVVAGLLVGGRHLLEHQAAQARGLIGKPLGDQAPSADKVYKKRHGERIELLLVGDSMAAGLGVDRAKDTMGARLSKGLAKRSRRAVRLRTVARVGAESSMLAGQLDSLPPTYRPDIAVVIVGGNDVTHRVPVEKAVRDLAACVSALQDLGAAVVVGTCPDLGALTPVPQPLRALGSRASRQLATAQRVAVLPLGAYAVDLAAVVGPFFVTNPDEMFSLDRFHPSALGYRRTAEAMLPSVLRALGLADLSPFGHHPPLL